MARKNKSTQRELEDLPTKAVGEIQLTRSYVIYGRSGTGKTTFSASFPGPILYIDVMDRGTDSISDVKGIRVYEVSTAEDFELAFWWLKKNPTKFKTIVIDTVSQLQTIKVKEHAAAKNVKGRAGDWGTMTKADWGEVSGWLKEWLMNYRDLVDDGMEVVFIAQDRAFNVSDDQDDDQEQMLAPEIGPSLMPSVAKTLNAAVSIIANTFIREREVTKKKENGKKEKSYKKEYCLGLAPSSLYTRKVRKPKSFELPEVIVDPDYDELMDILEGE